jgi:hypothetical protein
MQSVVRRGQVDDLAGRQLRHRRSPVAFRIVSFLIRS